jgi:hypothetical protein
MNFDKNDFVSYTEWNHNRDSVEFGDGKKLAIAGHGSVIVKGVHGMTLKLNNVILVPEVNARLMLVAKFTKKNITVVCFGCGALMMKKKKELAKLTVEDGLYRLENVYHKSFLSITFWRR